MRERRQVHDDAYFPLQGRGRRASRASRVPCGHQLLLSAVNPDGTRTCAGCG